MVALQLSGVHDPCNIQYDADSNLHVMCDTKCFYRTFLIVTPSLYLSSSSLSPLLFSPSLSSLPSFPFLSYLLSSDNYFVFSTSLSLIIISLHFLSKSTYLIPFSCSSHHRISDCNCGFCVCRSLFRSHCFASNTVANKTPTQLYNAK
jgi:hypothetical protein